jgi:hypothetical protein
MFQRSKHIAIGLLSQQGGRLAPFVGTSPQWRLSQLSHNGNSFAVSKSSAARRGRGFCLFFSGTFLSTISAIGGVLIALYYTGMVTVGSAVHARAPGALRNLLLREPIGKPYIQLVAFTTFLSLCLLAFLAMGFSPIPLAFPLLILLSGVTILSFVQLGQQAFVKGGVKVDQWSS